MIAAAGTIWLDVTRLLSRVGRGPFTGIDRVEHAYLAGLLARDLDVWGFARTATGFCLLDRGGLSEFKRRIDGHASFGPPDFEARLSRRLSPERRNAESDLRRLAAQRCLRPELNRFLRRNLEPGTRYVNVGHSNLSARMLGAVRSAGGRVVALVHDTIPLDLPALHRPGMTASFSERMRAVARNAEIVLCPSSASAQRIRHHLGRTAEVVALGFTRPDPNPVALFERCVPEDPYFVAVGTIDARKSQALLLDIWDRLGPRRPRLYLAGTRGWCPPDMIRRLDVPPDGVVELTGLDDGQVAALVEASAGLLHPSRAEGFGLPLLEAADLGVPVVARPLSVYRETLGDMGVYVSGDDLYQWTQTIEELAAAYRAGRRRQMGRPSWHTWDAHLNLVLSKL